MATAALDEKKLRGIVKAALIDAFKENRDLMQDIVEEALEDMRLPGLSSRAWKQRSSPAKRYFPY